MTADLAPPDPAPLAILDAHAHLYDSTVNRHAFLDRPDPTMTALVGDYSALPQHYLLADYLADSRSCRVTGLVAHEYLAADPLAEMRWLQRQADAAAVPIALVALADFEDPGLEARLDAYGDLPAITAVRQHLGWDDTRPDRHFASRPDLLGDPAWRRGLARLRPTGWRCGLEVFAPQLACLAQIVRQAPEIGFTIAVLGWPLDPPQVELFRDARESSASSRPKADRLQAGSAGTTPEAFAHWRRDLAALARCPNTRLSVSAAECIFGMAWTTDQLRPWLLTAIDLFGPARTMLGSHLPICKLSHGFAPLYATYRDLLAGFSAEERDLMFRGVAAEWFRVR